MLKRLFGDYLKLKQKIVVLKKPVLCGTLVKLRFNNWILYSLYSSTYAELISTSPCPEENRKAPQYSRSKILYHIILTMNCYTDCYLISMTIVFHASVFRVHLFANKHNFTLLLQKKHIDFAQIAKILSVQYH